MEKLKEEANAAAERYKAVKASGAKEESKGAYQAYQARVDDYRRARKEYESSFGTGDVEMGEVPEAGGVSMVSKPSTVAGTKSVGPASPLVSRVDVAKPVDISLEKGKTSVKTVEGSKQKPISAVSKDPSKLIEEAKSRGQCDFCRKNAIPCVRTKHASCDACTSKKKSCTWNGEPLRAKVPRNVEKKVTSSQFVEDRGPSKVKSEPKEGPVRAAASSSKALRLTEKAIARHSDQWGGLAVPGLGSVYDYQALKEKKTFSTDMVAAAKIYKAGLQVVIDSGMKEIRELDNLIKLDRLRTAGGKPEKESELEDIEESDDPSSSWEDASGEEVEDVSDVEYVGKGKGKARQ